jgi:hypothetical protein
MEKLATGIGAPAAGNDCAVWLERRVGGADTAATIQSYLKQLLHLDIPARLDQLTEDLVVVIVQQPKPQAFSISKLVLNLFTWKRQYRQQQHGRSRNYLETHRDDDIDETETRAYTVEIVGYMEAYPDDLSLIRRGLKLLLAMPHKSVVSEYSLGACFNILERLFKRPPELHSDILLYIQIRQMCFTILESMQFEQQSDEWMQSLIRLLCIIRNNKFDYNLGSLRAQARLLTNMMEYSADHSNANCKQLTTMLRGVRDIFTDHIDELQRDVASIQTDMASVDRTIAQHERLLDGLLQRCREIRNEVADDTLSDEELGQLRADYRELVDQHRESERELQQISERTRTYKQRMELYIEQELDD